MPVMLAINGTTLPLWAWWVGSLVLSLLCGLAFDWFLETMTDWFVDKRPIPGALFAILCGVVMSWFGLAPPLVVASIPLLYTLCWLAVWVGVAVIRQRTNQDRIENHERDGICP